MRHEGIARRMIRDLVEVYDITEPAELARKVDDLMVYFATSYPGKKDPADIQLIRATRGLVFLREMDLDEFYRSSRKLKQMLENR